MDEYIKTVLRAAKEVWTVFKTATLTGKNPKLAFEQLREKYKGTDAEDFAKRYTEICEEELPKPKDSEAYIADAKTITNEVWVIFNTNVKRLYAGEMTDGDWNRFIQAANNVAVDIKTDRWKYEEPVRTYAKRYSAMVVWELDRQYQRLHHIKEDWWKYV